MWENKQFIWRFRNKTMLLISMFDVLTMYLLKTNANHLLTILIVNDQKTFCSFLPVYILSHIAGITFNENSEIRIWLMWHNSVSVVRNVSLIWCFFLRPFLPNKFSQTHHLWLTIYKWLHNPYLSYPFISHCPKVFLLFVFLLPPRYSLFPLYCSCSLLVSVHVSVCVPGVSCGAKSNQVLFI